MISIKELCELIEKNQAKKIRISCTETGYGKEFYITLYSDEEKNLDDAKTSRFNYENQAYMNRQTGEFIQYETGLEELKALKKSLSANSSLQELHLNVEPHMINLLEGLKLPGMVSFAVYFPLVVENLEDLSALFLSTNSLTYFTYMPYWNPSYKMSKSDTEAALYEPLMKLISQNNNLKKLGLYDCLDKSNLKSIIEMIENLKQVTNLELFETDFHSYKSLLEVLPKRITELGLSITLDSEEDKIDLLSKAMLNNQSVEKLIVREQHRFSSEGSTDFGRFIPILDNQHITDLAFTLQWPNAQYTTKAFIEKILSKNNHLSTFTVNGKTHFDNRQYVVVQALLKKRVPRGPMEKVLSFLSDNKALNTVAYDSVVKQTSIKFSRIKQESKNPTEIKKQKEEERQRKKEASGCCVIL